MGGEIMKSAHEMPLFDPQKWMVKNQQMLAAQIMFSAIELNLFAHLSAPIDGASLAKKLDYDETNLIWMLNALTAIDMLKKEGDQFQNLEDTAYYLHPQSEMYLGDHLLYWRDMTSLSHLSHRVRLGPGDKKFKDENGADFFDFRAMGKGAQNTMYLGRVQQFIAQMLTLFEKEKAFSVLDLGAGSGILSIEILRNFPKAQALLWDQPSVCDLLQDIVADYGVQDRGQVWAGNFVKDEIPGTYDLIISAGILDFVGDLNQMAHKMKALLKEEGYIYIHTHGLNDAFTKPKAMVLGWLSSHLDGLSVLKSDRQIREAFEEAGFVLEAKNEPGRYMARKKAHA